MDYQKICEQSCQVVKSVGAFIRQQAESFSRDKVQEKGFHDFVSHVDTDSEERLVEALSQVLPEAGFIVEENTNEERGQRFNWVIDPLDGTTNFIHGLPPYSVSVALMDRDEVVMGIVYEINLDECFYAWEGSPAYCNGRLITVSNTKTVADALVATGFPYKEYDVVPNFLNSLEYFMRYSHGIRRQGSAAVDLCYVAAGRYEAFYEYYLHAWDVAAGAFILQQAGGLVSDFEAGNNYIFGGQIAATNGQIHREFLKILKDYLLT